MIGRSSSVCLFPPMDSLGKPRRSGPGTFASPSGRSAVDYVRLVGPYLLPSQLSPETGISPHLILLLSVLIL
jgi:hypothetical protein